MFLEEIENYAHLNNIPIMEKEGIEFLTEYIKKNKVTKILEIGSAIGYSAIKMALVNKNIHITTVERDKERYEEAVKNIKKMHLEKQIDIRNIDAFDLYLFDKYDLIFIDAAKAQYIKFFEKFKKNLDRNGVIVTDNINFHGLVNSTEEIKSRNVRALVRKINAYITFLKENEEFETTFYEIGDGVAISKRKKDFN